MSVFSPATWPTALPGLAACLCGFEYHALPAWRRALWVMALCTAALNVGASVHDAFAFDGYDLRIRVVGARLLLQGVDPYTYSSSSDYPPELQDPGQRFRGLSRCSYPPPLLLCYAPFTPLPYAVQRVLWMVLEWLALLATVALLSRLSPVARVRFLTATLCLGLVAGSYVWRFHVERGQYYVFIALLLTLGVRLLLRCRADHLGAGVLFGLAVALRPPVAVLLVPLWLGGLRRTALAGALTAGLCVAATLPLVGPDGYRNYLRMATQWEEVMLHYQEAVREYGLQPPEKGVVDGFRNKELELRGSNWTVGMVLGRLLNRVPGLPPVLHTGASQKLAYVVVLAFWLGLFYLAHRVRRFSTRETVLAAVWLMVLTDYFLPMRIEYADVLYLVPVALAGPALARERNLGWLLWLVLAWLPVVAVTGPHDSGYWIALVPLRGLILLTVCGLPWVAAWRARLGRRGVS